MENLENKRYWIWFSLIKGLGCVRKRKLLQLYKSPENIYNLTKKELLKIAYKLFMTKGYENTSVDEIIAEAKIAKGTYYYYFESKEATLEKVIEMMIEEECKKANEILCSLERKNILTGKKEEKDNHHRL